MGVEDAGNALNRSAPSLRLDHLRPHFYVYRRGTSHFYLLNVNRYGKIHSFFPFFGSRNFLEFVDLCPIYDRRLSIFRDTKIRFIPQKKKNHPQKKKKKKKKK